MQLLKKLLIATGTIIVLFFGGLALAIYATTYHPADIEAARLECPADAPTVAPGQKLKVLNWNVQYMASKNYTFWYDVPDGNGPDLRPSPEDIDKTFDEVARIIREEQPEIIHLQEVNDGAGYTDHTDQLAELLNRLPDEYRCYADAFYWKASFVPHPKVMGSVGMKLGTISKYRISSATRYQLPLIPNDIVSTQFNLKRALLETELPYADDSRKPLVSINTHLDAFAQGDDTMQRQVNFVHDRLSQLREAGRTFFISGDFNLLPPGFALADLPEFSRSYYNEDSELQPLFEDFRSPVSLAELLNPGTRARYFTFFSNSPVVSGPDRTIDHVFYDEPLRIENYSVRQQDTLHISDHLPMVFTIVLPDA